MERFKYCCIVGCRKWYYSDGYRETAKSKEKNVFGKRPHPSKQIYFRNINVIAHCKFTKYIFSSSFCNMSRGLQNLYNYYVLPYQVHKNVFIYKFLSVLFAIFVQKIEHTALRDNEAICKIFHKQ